MSHQGNTESGKGGRLSRHEALYRRVEAWYLKTEAALRAAGLDEQTAAEIAGIQTAVAAAQGRGFRIKLGKGKNYHIVDARSGRPVPLTIDNAPEIIAAVLLGQDLPLGTTKLHASTSAAPRRDGRVSRRGKITIQWGEDGKPKGITDSSGKFWTGREPSFPKHLAGPLYVATLHPQKGKQSEAGVRMSQKRNH